MPFVSIVSGCFNEAENVRELHEQIKAVFEQLPGYTWEHIYIDNASTDGTPVILREIARDDVRVKVILNARNFGHVRSPFHGLLQATGDAVIAMASDLEDPPSLIPTLLKKWEDGAKVVAAVKKGSKDSFALGLARKLYYRLIGGISDVKLIQNFTGFGLYDQRVIEALRRIDDPYPYFRGLISEIGFEPALVPFDKPVRQRGITKNNFFTLYDLAMLGITKHSVAPIRLATFAGFLMSGLSLLIAFGYLVAKLLFWQRFSMGTAPMLIGMFFFSSVQLFFIGVIGEYVASIHTQVRKLPLVIEEERINFPAEEAPRRAPAESRLAR
jgi:glycosyltransferase involved in cell wall biosynthesis